MLHRGLLIPVTLVLLGATPALAQDGTRWSFASAVNYSVGDYGTGTDTKIVSVPVTLGVTPLDRLWLSLTVPYIRQTTQNAVSTGGGIAARNAKSKGKLARPATATLEEGIGDALLKGAYLLVREADLIPEIAPYGRLKLPTADRDRGLGTGEFDETVGVDLAKRLVERVVGSLSLSYTFIGDPPGSDLRNSFGWSLGAAYAVIQPVSVFAFLEGATAVSPGQDDPVEVRVGAELSLTKALRVTAALTRGFTEGAADWGIAAGLALGF
jgi:hypothetical protein